MIHAAFMNFLEHRILQEGIVKEGNILKVDSFLNHQIDMGIMKEIAHEFQCRFKDCPFNKILTIESSGIAIATLLGFFHDVPVVFAKKAETANCTDDKYVSTAYSFTHRRKNHVFVSRPYLQATDRVLIVDDFLADGEAAHALIDLVHQAGASVVGIGIAIEKAQQKNRQNGADGAQCHQTEAVGLGFFIASDGGDTHAQRHNERHRHGTGGDAAGVKGHRKEVRV